MSGLLYKELVTVKNGMNRVQWGGMAMALVLVTIQTLGKALAFGGCLISLMFSLLVGILYLNGSWYDEKVSWQRYAATLPLSKGALVGSKYLLGLLMGLLCMVVSVAVFFLYGLYIGQFNWPLLLVQTAVCGLFPLYYGAVTLPLSQLLPYQMSGMIACVPPLLAVWVGVWRLMDGGGVPATPMGVAMSISAVSAAVVLVLSGVSYLITLGIYSRRQYS